MSLAAGTTVITIWKVWSRSPRDVYDEVQFAAKPAAMAQDVSFKGPFAKQLDP